MSKTIHGPKKLHGLSLLVVSIALLLAGCASDPTLGYIAQIENADTIDTASLFKEEIQERGRNIELRLMEKGRIAQLCGDYDTSRESFNSQIEILKERELEDDTTQGVEINVGSVAVNDNLLPYKARLFETQMLRLYQAYNYLAKKNLEGALIEIRNAEFLLNEAEKAREDSDYDNGQFISFENRVARKSLDRQNAVSPAKEEATAKKNESEQNSAKEHEPPKPQAQKNEENQEVQKTPEQIKEESVRSQAETEYGKYFDAMNDVLERAKSSYLNPYVVYLGGLLHEMAGEENDAYISYKKTLMLMPTNRYVQRDAIRLAKALNQDQDFDWLKTSFPEIWNEIGDGGDDKSAGRLVVIYEDGWAPRKEEVFISMAAVAVAYPVYRFQWVEPSPLAVALSGEGFEKSFESYPICYMNALALRALKEEAKWRIIRQTARVLLKGSVFATGATMAAASGNTYVKAAGVGIMVASAIYNNMSENADLRSWKTLPENVQIVSAHLPPRTFNLKISSKNSPAVIEKTLQIQKGQTVILRVIRVGGRTIVEDLWP